MASQDFTIDTKLRIAGVVASGKLDAGTLKFDVDASALKKLSEQAKQVATKVKEQLADIKLKKLDVQLNQTTLRSITSQIRGAIELAAKQAKITIASSAPAQKGQAGLTKKGEDMFSGAAKAATDLAKSISNISSSIDRLTQKFNGLASIIDTLASKRTPKAEARPRAERRVSVSEPFPLDPNAPTGPRQRSRAFPVDPNSPTSIEKRRQESLQRQQAAEAKLMLDQVKAAKEKSKTVANEGKAVGNFAPKVARLNEAIDQLKTTVNAFKSQLNPLASETSPFAKIGTNAKLVNDGMTLLKSSIAGVVRTLAPLSKIGEKAPRQRKPKWSDYGGYGSTIPEKPVKAPSADKMERKKPLGSAQDAKLSEQTGRLKSLVDQINKSFSSLVGKNALPTMAENVRAVNSSLRSLSIGLARITGTQKKAVENQESADQAQQKQEQNVPLASFSRLISQANTGLRGLIRVLERVSRIQFGKGGKGGGTGGGMGGPEGEISTQELASILGGAKVQSLDALKAEAASKPKTSFLGRENDFTQLVSYEQKQAIKAAEAMEAAYSKVERARLKRLQRLSKELGNLVAKERELIAQQSGTKVGDIKTGYFGGGYVPGAGRGFDLFKTGGMTKQQLPQPTFQFLPNTQPAASIGKAQPTASANASPTIIDSVVTQLLKKVSPELAKAQAKYGSQFRLPEDPRTYKLGTQPQPKSAIKSQDIVDKNLIPDTVRQLLREVKGKSDLGSIALAQKFKINAGQTSLGQTSDIVIPGQLKTGITKFGSQFAELAFEGMQKKSNEIKKKIGPETMGTKKYGGKIFDFYEDPKRTSELEKSRSTDAKVISSAVQQVLGKNIEISAAREKYGDKFKLGAKGVERIDQKPISTLYMSKLGAEMVKGIQSYQTQAPSSILFNPVGTPLKTGMPQFDQKPLTQLTAEMQKMAGAMARNIPFAPAPAQSRILFNPVGSPLKASAPQFDTKPFTQLTAQLSQLSNVMATNIRLTPATISTPTSYASPYEYRDYRRPAGGAGAGGGGGGRSGGGGRGGMGAGAMPGGGGMGGGGSRSVSDLADAMEKVQKRTNEAQEEMNELEKISFEVGRKAATFRAIAIALNTVVTSAQAALKFVKEFTDGLLELNKILQLSQSSLRAVGDQVIALSRSTGVATSDIIAISTEFARAGLQGRGFGDSLELTKRALEGVQGTSLTAAQSTEILIQTIQQIEGGARGLSKELVTTSKLFDILGRAEDITASKATDIQDAFKRSLGSLTATGASMEELVSIISVVEERTQRGGDVIGTAFKTLASRIGNSTSEASDALRSIGVETVDSEGKLRNLFDVLAETSARFQGLSEAEQANIAVKVAGIRQVEIFRAAVSNFSRLQEVNNELTNASGDAARKAGIEQQKFSVIINKLTASLQELVKNAAESFIGDIFIGALKAAEGLLGAVANLDTAFGGVVSKFAAGGATLLGFKVLVPLFKGFRKAFDFFVKGGVDAGKGMSLFSTAAGKAGIQIKTGVNAGLEQTAQTMLRLNQLMDEFNQKQQLAQVQAQKVANAREQAVRMAEAEGKGKNPAYVQRLTNEILGKQERELAAARMAGLSTMAQERGGRASIREAMRMTPDQFSEEERARFAPSVLVGTKEKEPSFVKTKAALSKTLNFIGNHPIMTGVAFAALGSGLDVLAQKTQSTSLAIASSAVQFASMGALLGPWGLAVGGLIGLFKGLWDSMTPGEQTIEMLIEKYKDLGIAESENGQVTSDTRQEIEGVNKSLSKIKNYEMEIGKAATARANLSPEDRKIAENKSSAALMNASSSLLQNYNRNAAPEVRQQQVASALNEAFKNISGVEGIDLTSDMLFKEGSGLADVITAGGQQFVDDMFKAFEAIVPSQEDISALQRIRQEAFDAAEQESRQAIENAKMQSENVMAQLGKASPSEGLKTLIENLTAGKFDEKTRKEFEQAQTGTFRAYGPDFAKFAENQAMPNENRFDAASRIVKDLAEQARAAGLAQLKVVEQRSGGQMPPSIAALMAKTIRERGLSAAERGARRGQNVEAQNTQIMKAEAQSRIFFNLQKDALAGSKLSNIKMNESVNSLELVLRNFVSSFSSEIMKMKEVAITARTEEKKIAQENLSLAQEALANARKEARFVISDAVKDLQRTITAGGAGEGEEAFPGLDRSIMRGTEGRLLPQYEAQLQAAQAKNPNVTEREALGVEKTKRDVVNEVLSAFLGIGEQLIKSGITDPEKIRASMEQADIPSLSVLNDQEIKTIAEGAKKILTDNIGALVKVDEARIKVTQRLTEQLNFTLAEEMKRIELDKRRRDVLYLAARAGLEELTGIRALVAARSLEAKQAGENAMQSESRVASLNKLIAAEKEALKQEDTRVAAKNNLVKLEEELNNELIALDTIRAEELIANQKAILSAAQEVIQAGQKEADYRRSLISSQSELADALSVGERQIERFNRKLDENASSFRQTQAALASEIAIINATVKDEAEKKERLIDVQRRSAAAALDAAKAEAQIIAERRQAVQQITQELLGNQQEQVSAQKAVIDATKAVSEAYMSYVESVQGAILATTQYNLGIKLAQVETVRLTGGFTGIKENLAVVTSTFKQAESAARQLGANEKTLVDIRRQSIEQQLSLFNQLLSQQSSLARSFFQSSAEDQAALFQGIQSAKMVADMLGGSFDNFRSLGEDAINSLGSQLLALPQQTRQQLVSSLETLSQVGGATVGGFTPDQLLTAIETASLGVSSELDVDPLFEVQKRIADLNEQQARLATEQLISSQLSVDQAKQQLEEAKAARGLAEIQLERIKEEGNQLRNKLTEVNGDLRTVLLQQNATSANGFNSVTGIIARTNYILENVLPAAFSSSVAQAASQQLSQTPMAIPGLNAPPAKTTAGSRGYEMTDALRQGGNNAALQKQLSNQSVTPTAIIGDSFSSSQQRTSNVPGGNSTQETNSTLNEILKALQNLNTATTTNSQVLTEIRDQSGNTVGTASATIAGTGAAPEITVNIQGEQRVTVTGFEAGVTRIAQGLAEAFGGFATETEAREIAETVVEAIRTELQRLNILQRNQF